MKIINQGPLEGISSDDEYLDGARKQLEESIQSTLDDMQPRLREGKQFVVINGVKFDAHYIANLMILLKLVQDGQKSVMELAPKITSQLWTASQYWRNVRLNLWRLGG